MNCDVIETRLITRWNIHDLAAVYISVARLLRYMHTRTHAGYFNTEFVHSVAVWFPLLIKQQIQRRQRSSLANVIAAIGIFLVLAS